MPPEAARTPAEIPTLEATAAPREAPRRKLDFSGVTPPENLEEVRLEETTIDGICGVY